MVATDDPRVDNAGALQKATTSDFNSGALLSPEQFDDFMEDVQEMSRFLSQTRMFTPSAPSGDIPRLDIPPQQLIAASEATDPGSDASFTQEDVPFSTSKVTLQHEFSWESINEVIDDPESTIRRMFAQRFASDLEILGSIGDGTTGTFQAINEGWLTRASARGVANHDHQDSGTSAKPVDNELFESMLNLMPEKHKAEGGEDNLVFMTSWNNREAYKQFLVNRDTAGGDRMLMSGDVPTPYGYDIVCPLGFPDDQAMLTDPQNLGYVVQDSIRTRQTSQAERNVRADVETIMAMYAKVDFVILDEGGVVTASNIEAPGAGA